MNYFSPKSAAERYAKGRPDYHSLISDHIQDYLTLKKKLNKALDIACGTGLSARALLPIATEIYGTDASEEMLNLAVSKDEIHYEIAAAEKQPFKDHEFDLITVSSGVHWFNIEKFLKESHRLLKKNAWLVLYENHFSGDMQGETHFSFWYQEVYMNKFPPPPRNDTYDWSAKNLARKNFDLKLEEKFSNPVSFTKKELCLYFTTQSNIIRAVEEKEITYVEAERWLSEELSAFYENDDIKKVVYYGNSIQYLQAK